MGFPHPDHLTPLLTSAQVAEWRAYAELEPFGPLRWALYAARIVIAVLAPWRKKSAGAMKPADVFPELGDGGRAKTTGELREAARRWAAGYGPNGKAK